MAILSTHAIEAMGFKSHGKNLHISDKASFYGASGIALGDNVRIDDFCVLSAGSGGITVGRNVHIAVYSSLIGAAAIRIADFCNISSRVSIYSSSDDYSGEWMTNPTIPPNFTNVTHGDVTLEKHVIIGAGCVILPNSLLHEGVAIGALSLVNSVCAEYGIYCGVPAKRIKDRSRQLCSVERDFQKTVHR